MLKPELKKEDNQISLYVNGHKITDGDKTIVEYTLRCDDWDAYEKKEWTISLKESKDGVYYLYGVSLWGWENECLDYLAKDVEIRFPSSFLDLDFILKQTDEDFGINDWEREFGDDEDEDEDDAEKDRPYTREWKNYDDSGRLILHLDERPEFYPKGKDLKDEGFIGEKSDRNSIGFYTACSKNPDKTTARELLYYLAYMGRLTPDVLFLTN